MAPIPKRISQLDAAGPLSGAEQFPLVQNERTKQVSLNSLRDFTDMSCQCTLVSRYNEVACLGQTGVQYLFTYTLPANTLSTDGSWLDITASGKFAANNNFKYAGVHFRKNGSIIAIGYSTETFQYNDYYWNIELKVQRSADNGYTSTRRLTVAAYNGGFQSGNTPDMYIDYTSGTSSNLWNTDSQIVVLCVATSGVASDITCGQFIVSVNKLDANS